MKKIFIYYGLVVFAAASCKKKDQTSSPVTPADNTEQTIEGIPPKADSVYGVFVLTELPTSAPLGPVYQGKAAFTSQPKHVNDLDRGENSVKGYMAGLSVKINGADLKYFNVDVLEGKHYEDRSVTNYESRIICELAPSDSLPGFQLKATRAFPQVTDLSFIPSSFSKSQDLVLNLGKHVQNADSVYLLLWGGLDIEVYKAIPGNQSQVTFTKQELAMARTGTDFAMLMVVGKNYSYKVVDKKTFAFLRYSGTVQANIDVNP